MPIASLSRNWDSASKSILFFEAAGIFFVASVALCFCKTIGSFGMLLLSGLTLKKAIRRTEWYRE